jgi:hypothetical protein
MFDFIKNDLFTIINLEIDFVKADILDELKDILLNNKYKVKHIFTKSVPTIKNFIEYNNIENIKIHETDLNIIKSYKYDKE